MKNQTHQLKFAIYILTISFVFTSLGCEPLRKKFVRKKKEKKQNEEIIPILDPIDYPPVFVSPQEIYAHHYSLWKVWHRDLVEQLGDDVTDKKIKYTLTQMIAQLEEMKKVISESKHADIDGMVSDLNGIVAEMEKPAGLRQMTSVRNDLEAMRKKMHKEYNPKLPLEYKN